MAVTSEILKKYCEVDVNPETGDSTLFCMVKWNSREPKGYDIRKYIKEKDGIFKGITISYEALEKIILTSIEEGLVDVNKIKDKIDEYQDKIFSTDDFDKMFKKITNEDNTYSRDKYGYLRDDKGRVVISKRIK